MYQEELFRALGDSVLQRVSIENIGKMTEERICKGRVQTTPGFEYSNCIYMTSLESVLKKISEDKVFQVIGVLQGRYIFEQENCEFVN